MKKIVLVLGLVMGSMLVSDVCASINKNGAAVESNIDHNKDGKKKKKCKKACCKHDATATETSKGCSKEGTSCCKKKKTSDAPTTAPSN
jgi:hypothetical protein